MQLKIITEFYWSPWSLHWKYYMLYLIIGWLVECMCIVLFTSWNMDFTYADSEPTNFSHHLAPLISKENIFLSWPGFRIFFFRIYFHFEKQNTKQRKKCSFNGLKDNDEIIILGWLLYFSQCLSKAQSIMSPSKHRLYSILNPVYH